VLQHFGATKEQCKIREKKGVVKRVHCKFTATSPTRNYHFKFEAAPVSYIYTLTDKYDKARAFAKKQKEKTLARYACLQTFDPKDLDQVFSCIGALREVRGLGGKSVNILEGRLGGCSQARSVYVDFLQAHSLISVQEWEALKRNVPGASEKHRVPDCAMFARVGQELTGKPLRWADCVDYENSPPHLC